MKRSKVKQTKTPQRAGAKQKRARLPSEFDKGAGSIIIVHLRSTKKDVI